MTAVLQSLTPPQLAGVLGAILTGENISKPQIWVAYEPTQEIIDAVQALEGAREQLYKAQVQYGIQAPLSIDLRLAGISYLNPNSLHHRCSQHFRCSSGCHMNQ